MKIAVIGGAGVRTVIFKMCIRDSISCGCRPEDEIHIQIQFQKAKLLFFIIVDVHIFNVFYK